MNPARIVPCHLRVTCAQVVGPGIHASSREREDQQYTRPDKEKTKRNRPRVDRKVISLTGRLAKRDAVGMRPVLPVCQRHSDCESITRQLGFLG